MRTTIDITPGLHQRITSYAKLRGQSFSATANEALMRGMAQTETPSPLHRSPITGLLVVNTGQPITTQEVADLIDEDN